MAQVDMAIDRKGTLCLRMKIVKFFFGDDRFSLKGFENTFLFVFGGKIFLKNLFSLRIPSVLKKQAMAISGGVLGGFVLVHMLGNLKIFEGPEAINAYAAFLKNLPWEILMGFRLVLFLAAVVHIVTGILLTLENWRARPNRYAVKQNIKTSWASRTMIWTGLFLGLFLVLHLLHFTFRLLFPEYNSVSFNTQLAGKEVYNVYKMIITGFSIRWIPIVYVFSMGVLCLHLSHGISSLFQTLGLCNEKWRPLISKLAVAYAVLVFLGFILIPIRKMLF